MAMETTGKYCCECIHYLHGVLENPCKYNMRSVGYLNQGCWRWESENGTGVEMPTKKCSICGEVKEIAEFVYDKGKYTHYCKACRLVYKERKKRRNKCDESD